MEKKSKCCGGKMGCGGGACGLWVAGWLFTIGFLHLAFWKGVLALLLWPYYLGIEVALMAKSRLL